MLNMFASLQGVPLNRGLRRRLSIRLRSKRSFVNLEKYSDYTYYRLTLLVCTWDTLYIIDLKLPYSLLGHPVYYRSEFTLQLAWDTLYIIDLKLPYSLLGHPVYYRSEVTLQFADDQVSSCSTNIGNYRS